MDKNQNQNQIQIQITPEVANGRYSNLAMVGHSANDMLIDFIFVAPGMPQAPLVSRIIMTPENAKKLMFALNDNIKKYEENFGEIEMKQPKNAPKNPFNKN